jgi:hypothetical protein
VSERSQVVGKGVALFIPILRHEAMAKCIIGNVAVNLEVVGSMDNNAALIRFANQVLGYNRASNVTRHMEMDRL